MAVESGGERPSFYEPSRDRRCVSNAAAVIFYSLLGEDADDDRIDAIGETFLTSFTTRNSAASAAAPSATARNTGVPSTKPWRSSRAGGSEATALQLLRPLPRPRSATISATEQVSGRSTIWVRSRARGDATRGMTRFAIYALALDGDNLVDMMRATTSLRTTDY